MRKQLPAEHSAGMRAREIRYRKATGVEQRQRESIAQRERRGGARGGGEPQWAGFDVDAGVEMDIGGQCERGFLVSRKRNEAGALTFQVRKQRNELIGFTGIR